VSIQHKAITYNKTVHRFIFAFIFFKKR